MKKLYSLMLLLATVAVSFTASAKSFTISVDDASRVTVRNSLEGYEPIEFENNSFTVTDATDDAYPFPVMANSDYEIVSATESINGSSVADSYTTFPTQSFSITVANVPDGATVNIVTREREVPTVTITTSDASLLSVECCSQTVTAVDNVFTAKVTDQYGSLVIRIAEDKSDEWGILKATSDSGTDYYPNAGALSIYLGGISGNMSLNVETVNLAESRTATMNVTVNGDPEAVVLRRSDNTQVTLTGASTAVKFNPESETSFTLEPAIYGKTFYKVTLGETVLTSSYNTYHITAADGCNLVVDVDWPEIYAPVSFTFVNEGTEGAIAGVVVNGQNVENWAADDFKVKLGSTLNVNFNTTTYSISDVKLNGQSVSTYGYGMTVTEETPLNFTVTAQKNPEYNVTFVCEDYTKVLVYNGYGYTESELIPLTGEETTFTVSQGYPYLTVKAVDGYRVTELIDGTGNSMTIGYSNYLTGDIEIFAVVEEIVRPNSFTLYVEPTADWAYRIITLSQSDNTLRKDLTGDMLPYGYSVVNFADFDAPVAFGGYPTLHLYRNDEAATLTGGTLPELADGDVIKMFVNEPQSYALSYTVAEGVSIEIEHDHANVIENPSTHTVLQGTEVVITPAADDSPVAQVAARTAAPVVKVNDEIITPDTEGKYMFAVNADSNVSVEPGTPAGIDSIEAIEGGADTPVYNLQGIRVGKASDLRHLPAGLYISGGQKIRK